MIPEEEKSILLGLSNEIASARSRSDLLRVLEVKLRELFSISTFGITLINEEDQTHSAFVVDPEERIKKDVDFQRMVTQKYSLPDIVISKIISADEPVVFDVEELAAVPDHPEYVSFWIKMKVQQILGVSLRVGKKDLGCLLFHLDRHSVSIIRNDLVQSVSAQIAVAVSNIVANEQLTKREEEKTILLSLSAEIASLRSRSDFFRLVNAKVKELFSITEYGIAHINEDSQTYSAFMLDLTDSTQSHADYKRVTNAAYSINDPVFSAVMNSDDPIILKVDELAKEPDIPEYIFFWKKIGLPEVLCVALRVGGNNIGCVYLHVDRSKIPELKTSLLKGVCAELSVAISNILANEQIAKREEEKTILLSLSSEIASLKNRTDLFRVVNTRIKGIFSINEYAIATITEDGRSYIPFMMDLDEAITSHHEFKKIAAVRNSIDDIIFRKVINSDEPVLFDVNEMALDPEVPGYFIFWKNVGVKKVLYLPLKAGGRDIGCTVFHVDNSQLFPSKYNLLKSICSQLAVAVSNILALEKIERREKETETLLLVNTDISAARNNDELLQAINNHPKKLLSFSHTAIGIVDDDRTTLGAFLLDPQSKSRDHPEYAYATRQNYSINDEVLNKILSTAGPVVYDLKQLQANNKLPFFLKMSLESGIQQVIAVRFCKADFVFGLWMMFFEVPIALGASRSRLIQELSNQLSIAVSNITANLEIERREEEKSKLLAFSNALASVQDKNLLAKILKKQLQELFVIQDYAIHALSKDKKTHRLTLFDPDAPFAKHPDFSKLVEIDTDVNDGVFNKILASEGPVNFNVEEWYNSPSPPSYSEAAKSINLKKMTGMALRLGQENIGLINFIQDEFNQVAIQQPLFKSICSQLATTLSNILANEDIQGREREKARLLEFSNAIASVRDKFLLAKILKQQLFDLFSIKDYLINVLLDDKKSFIPLLYDQDADFIKDPTFQKTLHNPTDIHDGIFDEILKNEEPVTFNVDEWSTWENPPSYLDTAVSIGLRKMTGVRIRLGDEDIAILNFRHDSFDLTPTQHKLLKSICSQIAIAVSNIIANEEIEGREREKTRLLEFSNTLASARDKFSLSKILRDQLQDLFSIDDFSVNVLVDNKQKFLPFLYDQDADFIKDPAFQKILNTPTGIHDGVFDKTLGSEDPVTFNVEEWSTWQDPPPYLETAISIGLKRMTGVRIRLGQDDIAVLNCRHDDFELVPSQLRLLKGISSQIAIAVSNIMANEKVNDQLDQINRYKLQLEEEKIYLKEEIETTHNYSEIIGESPTMKKVFRLVAQVAPSDSTVLILGETGTGKELIARAIHNSSPRKNKLMVKVNCAAFPVNLIESELFGHERGSFTGAIERRIGKFELANHGTLFLDEIGEMPLELQVKLLRALQEKEIERVGGRTTIKVDVRIIAATNRDLEKLMAEGRFRNDLYYRLNIFPISLPSLRNRKEDIPALASHFILRFAKKAGKKIKGLTNKALQQLIEYQWPGNIRELEHLIERSVLVTDGDTIKEIHLPAQKQNKSNIQDAEDTVKIKTIDDNEKSHILKVLKYCKGRVSGPGGAAELLDVPSSTLNSKMKRLGIKKEHFG